MPGDPTRPHESVDVLVSPATCTTAFPGEKVDDLWRCTCSTCARCRWNPCRALGDVGAPGLSADRQLPGGDCRFMAPAMARRLALPGRRVRGGPEAPAPSLRRSPQPRHPRDETVRCSHANGVLTGGGDRPALTPSSARSSTRDTRYGSSVVVGFQDGWNRPAGETAASNLGQRRPQRPSVGQRRHHAGYRANEPQNGCGLASTRSSADVGGQQDRRVDPDRRRGHLTRRTG